MKKTLSKTALFVLFLLLACHGQSQTDKNYYTQTGNRLAAEWEPALGTMITWPLCVPYKLAVELAKDNHLYVLVNDERSKAEAVEWFNKWNIEKSSISFINVLQGVDTWWVRDWGPGAVFPSKGKMMLADPKYIYSTPVSSIGCEDSLDFLYKTASGNIIKTDTDDLATIPLAKGLTMPVLDLPFVATGGNVATDGMGSAFSTCILLSENKFFNVPADRFIDLNKKLLGIDNYHIISNFEKRGIQHIDCYMKILDEERILVCEPPPGHSLYKIYQDIIDNDLSKLKTVYGRSYQIVRIKSDTYNGKDLAAYTNSIIINKVIYVPLFKIKQDSIALQTWRELMPGYRVKGFNFLIADEPFISTELKRHYPYYGWNSGDALHCRTRAVWDPEMIFITTKKVIKEVSIKDSNKIYATIIDYSNKGLVPGKTELVWRATGDTDWSRLPMNKAGVVNGFYASIPYHKSGAVIEYYISAASRSGKIEKMPRTAPFGTYMFSIK